MSNTWEARIRGDVSPNLVPSLIHKAGLKLSTMDTSLKDRRHLQCEAPVAIIAVKNLCAEFRYFSFENIVRIADDRTSFDVYPDDSSTLSEMDYAIGRALKLSDPSLLKAMHVGPLFEFTFRNPDSVVSAMRWKLFELGIELCHDPSLLPDKAIEVMAADQPQMAKTYGQ